MIDASEPFRSRTFSSSREEEVVVVSGGTAWSNRSLVFIGIEKLMKEIGGGAAEKGALTSGKLIRQT
jgi:hypothetical protein